MSVAPVPTSASSLSGASAGASAAPSALAGGSTQDRSAWPSAGAATRTPSKAAAETSRRRAITGLLLSRSEKKHDPTHGSRSPARIPLSNLAPHAGPHPGAADVG